MVLFMWSGYKQKERNHCDYLKKGHVILEKCYTSTIINCKRAALEVRKSKKLLPPICWETNVGGRQGFQVTGWKLEQWGPVWQEVGPGRDGAAA